MWRKQYEQSKIKEIEDDLKKGNKYYLLSEEKTFFDTLGNNLK